jgi:undecaprenyl-diphosphatase
MVIKQLVKIDINKNDILILLILLLILIFKIIYVGHFGLVPDEAYYWEWSREIAFGYYDHPPFIAWLIFLSREIFGDTLLGVRALTVVCSFFSSFILYLLAKKYLKNILSFIFLIILSNFIILFGIGSLLATPDIPLVLFWSLSILMGYNAIFNNSKISWILLGISCGLGLLSKYTFVLFFISLFIFILFSKEHKKFINNFYLYFSVIIAFVVFLPNIIWNYNNNWCAFKFQLSHGISKNIFFNINTLGDFLAGQIGVLSIFPFILLFIAIIHFLKRNMHPDILYLISFCMVPFFFFLLASLQKKVEANWPACAYISGLLITAVYFEKQKCLNNKKIMFFSFFTLIVSFVVTAIIYVHIIKPFLPLDPKNDPTFQTRGWKTFAEDINKIRAKADPLYDIPICTNRYQDISLISFYLSDHPKGFALNTYSRSNQFSIWENRKPKENSNIFFIHPISDKNLDLILSKCFYKQELLQTITFKSIKKEKKLWGFYSCIIK